MFPFALIFGAIGAVASIAGSFIQAGAAQQQAKASQDEERLREQQLNLESARQRRQAIRNTLAARSQALVAGTAQGASFGSGVAGGTSQVANQGAENILGINQAQKIGGNIFADNRTIAAAGAQASFGEGLSSLGRTISGLNVG